MKVINENANLVLWNAGQSLFVGFVSGPIRALGGIVQTIVNLVAAFFLIIPSLCGLINGRSKWHAAHFICDCATGVGHIVRGVIETIPFTSLILKQYYKPTYDHRGKWIYMPHQDRPFERAITWIGHE